MLPPFAVERERDYGGVASSPSIECGGGSVVVEAERPWWRREDGERRDG